MLIVMMALLAGFVLGSTKTSALRKSRFVEKIAMAIPLCGEQSLCWQQERTQVQ
jgi:hypothetical protein